MLQKKDERFIGIITGTTFEQGWGRAKGKTVLTLQILGTSGVYQDREFRKYYFYDKNPPADLQRDFLLLGFRIECVADIAPTAMLLIGRIVRFSFVYDGSGRRSICIDEYVGSKDPSKYIKQNTPQ